MYECDRWYEYKGKDQFEKPPIYMKYQKDFEYYVIALYPFISLQLPGVSLFGPYQHEKMCDDLMSQFINN